MIDLDRLQKTAGIVGNSDAIKQALEMMAQVSTVDISVLITGESGTGKEMVAKGLHKFSKRSQSELVTVNCGAIPEGIIESELFGHKKGAFTGAIERKDGKFLAANSGSIFLDEIGDMSPSLQSKILRVLESGEIERVGGAETIRVDVRIISATNQDLEQKIKDGTFRQDLYHRINVFPLTVPPLRDRKEDIYPTVMSILKNLKKKHKISVNYISHGGIQTLESYDWPGNVRELENILERVVLIHDKPTLKSDDIKYILDEHTSNINVAALPQSRPTPSSEPSTDSVETSKAEAGSPSTVSIDTTAVKTLKELEYEAIVVGLERTNWNMTTTARQLGISRMTLYRKLDQHGLRKKD